MPELPEVETTRAGLLPYVVGRRVTAVTVRNAALRYPVPRSLSTTLTGQVVRSVSRRAKYLLFEFPSGTLIIHLGMSGSLRIVAADEAPQKHDHFDMEIDTKLRLRLRDPRRFGCVIWTNQDPFRHPLLNELGIEPLGDQFNGDYLHAQAHGRKISVKQYIMDGRIVVGVGNIYASESLFRAGILPTRPAGRVSLERYRRLADAIKAVLTAAIAQGGTTLRDFSSGEGKPGYFQQQLQVYGRAAEPCRRCATPLIQRVIGQRSTFYCRACQT